MNSNDREIQHNFLMKDIFSRTRILALVLLVFAAIPDMVMSRWGYHRGWRKRCQRRLRKLVYRELDQRTPWAWQYIQRRHGRDDANDAYGNSFTANWTNEHHGHGSIFNDGTDETTVWWESNASGQFLFIEAPLVAKNMIWGAGVSAEELALYDDHNTHKESNGKPHHGPLSGIDYNMAVGSEKAIFEGITAKLEDDSVSGTTSGLVANATSRDYLVNNAMTCNTTDCSALTTTMSFEFQFDLGVALLEPRESPIFSVI